MTEHDKEIKKTVRAVSERVGFAAGVALSCGTAIANRVEKCLVFAADMFKSEVAALPSFGPETQAPVLEPETSEPVEEEQTVEQTKDEAKVEEEPSPPPRRTTARKRAPGRPKARAKAKGAAKAKRKAKPKRKATPKTRKEGPQE